MIGKKGYKVCWLVNKTNIEKKVVFFGTCAEQDSYAFVHKLLNCKTHTLLSYSTINRTKLVEA
jgi:hypothetical protein